ncbi:NADP-dependent 3-hydroxy acid dehydrogenase YdfG [Planctomycetes bacterium Pla163]|uniref:NADP-dependent 3-hydroxy acid dehydrogenase YdfG n=1 Tax=Rohdeia mirabilis TaxID=2528008 RepID=A0A518D000_9BACT|nr:NADP-dependent 3-hydroxy acid dehydrogenase YdfG [Planctomycetes bacterium Pla163]
MSSTIDPTRPLAGRLALVTGASAGIGAATARALFAAGARPFLAARREERLVELSRELGDCPFAALDVRDAAGVQAALAGQAFDIVVNNAGLASGVDPLPNVSAADVDLMLDTNVKGVLNVARATLPGMLERDRGDHVVLGSVAGRQVYPGGGVYCATKHAVRALYEGLRQDAAGHGVRFTTVDPGMVETEFSNVRFKGDGEKAAAVYKGFEALRPSDVADAILFALSRPAHVNIGEIVLWPTAQASTTRVTRS